MRIHTLWGEREHSASSTPIYELLVAWDEHTVDGNPAGWEKAKDAAIEDLGDDLLQWREAFLSADDLALEKLFEIPDLSKPAKIQNPLGHPPGVR